MDRTMKRKPSTEATAAWIRLMRVQSRVLDAVEQDMKKAGFPPLAWYDALLELSRAPAGEPVQSAREIRAVQDRDDQEDGAHRDPVDIRRGADSVETGAQYRKAEHAHRNPERPSRAAGK